MSTQTLTLRKPTPAPAGKGPLSHLLGRRVAIRTRGHTICTGTLTNAGAGQFIVLQDMHEQSEPDHIDRRWPGLTYLDKGAILFVAEVAP